MPSFVYRGHKIRYGLVAILRVRHESLVSLLVYAQKAACDEDGTCFWFVKAFDLFLQNDTHFYIGISDAISECASIGGKLASFPNHTKFTEFADGMDRLKKNKDGEWIMPRAGDPNYCGVSFKENSQTEYFCSYRMTLWAKLP